MFKFALIFSCCTTLAFAANILLVPAEHGSHVNFFSNVGEILSSKGGHNTFILACPRQLKILRKLKHVDTRFILPEGICKDNPLIHMFSNVNDSDSSNPLSDLLKKYPVMKSISTVVSELTEHFLIEMLPKSNVKFDLVIVDGMDFVRSYYAIPFYLKVPYITLHGRPDPWTFSVPAIPANEGFLPLEILDENSSFFARFLNTFAFIVTKYIFVPSLYDPTLVNRLVPDAKINIDELVSNSAMVLLNHDPISCDFPRIETSNYRHLGSFGAHPGKPLSSPFKEFVDAADKGFVLVTFGSGIATIPDYILNKILTVASRIGQRLVIRHKGDDPSRNYPENVMVNDWLPQNDLLAHPKCKVFVAHGGANGQMESIFHGVPQIIIGFFGDQIYNGERAKKRKIGKSLDRFQFTADELHDAINDLMSEPYVSNIKKASETLRDLPDGADTVLFWTNHILEFGGQHLRSIAADMPFYKVIMLDFIFMITVIVVTSWYLAKVFLGKLFCKQ